jgi:hypothetical protein
MRVHLKDNISELGNELYEQNIRDLCRRINEFKESYQSRSNLVKDENGDLLADSHNNLNRLKKYFSQLSYVHSVSDIRQLNR